MEFKIKNHEKKNMSSKLKILAHVESKAIEKSEKMKHVLLMRQKDINLHLLKALSEEELKQIYEDQKFFFPPGLKVRIFEFLDEFAQKSIGQINIKESYLKGIRRENNGEETGPFLVKEPFAFPPSPKVTKEERFRFAARFVQKLLPEENDSNGKIEQLDDPLFDELKMQQEIKYRHKSTYYHRVSKAATLSTSVL